MRGFQVILFIISFLISTAMAAIFKKVLFKNILSNAKERPVLLGLSIYLSVLISCLIAVFCRGFSSALMIRVLIGSALIFSLGIVDDIKNLSVGQKLLGQIIAAAAVTFLGVRTSIYYFPVWVNITITIIWITAMVNAFNLLDIMDGLCAGIAFIISASFIAVSAISHQPQIGLFFCIVSGALAASLIFNLPPAKLYLGDSGSMLLGFVFACGALSISYAQDSSQSLSLLTPLIILAVPLYDMAFAVFMRRKKGIAVVKKSDDHFALIMKALGFSTKKILFIMYGICILFAGCGILLKALAVNSKIWLLAALLFFLVLLALFISRAEARLSNKA